MDMLDEEGRALVEEAREEMELDRTWERKFSGPGGPRGAVKEPLDAMTGSVAIFLERKV